MAVDLLVGTQKGAVVFRGDDERRSWQASGLMLGGWSVTSATRDGSGRTYAAIASDIYGPAIAVSDDLRSWRQLENAPRYSPDDKGNADHNRIIRAGLFSEKEGVDERRHLDQIWKLLAVGDVLYAGVSEAGLFRSADRGESWEPVEGLNDHPDRGRWVPGAGGLCAHTLLADGKNADRLWVGISAAGVFRTDDGGKTWVSKNDGVDPAGEGFCVHALAHDPADADVIYRQDHRGVYRTEDGGDRWQLIETGLPKSTLADDHECCFGFPMVFDRESEAAFVVPLDGDNFRYPRDGKLKVYRTTDGGAHWAAAAEGLPEGCYAGVLRGAMAADHLDPCGLYLGTTAGTVHASADGAESWQQLPGTLPRVLSVQAFTAP